MDCVPWSPHSSSTTCKSTHDDETSYDEDCDISLPYSWAKATGDYIQQESLKIAAFVFGLTLKV